MSADIESAARHEAAHALVALALGARVVEVVISSGDNFDSADENYCHTLEPKAWRAPSPSCRHKLAIAIAGDVAEGRASRGADTQRASQYATDAGAALGVDAAVALAEQERLVGLILRAQAAELDAVAAALVDRRRLTGDDLAAIVGSVQR